VARATLYTYFPDFEHVLHALVQDEVDRLHDRLDQQLADLHDPGQRPTQQVSAMMKAQARSSVW
jgi:AcrR family transcriptional regulator